MPLRSRALPLLTLALAAAFAAAEEPSFTFAASAPASPSYSVRPTGISRDGGLVSVTYYDADEYEQTATWTPENGFTLRPNPLGREAIFGAMTADGRFLLGHVNNWAAIWGTTGAPVELERPGQGTGSFASCGSFDGATIGGTISNAMYTAPVIWRNGVLTRLQQEGMAYVGVTGVSDDGETIVGYTGDDYSHVVACRWNAQGIRTALTLSAPFTGAAAFPVAVSADGTITLVNVTTGDGPRVLLHSAGGTRSLGYVPGFPSDVHARAMSADGTAVVGVTDTVSDDAPFLWDKVHGMRDLRAALEANGLGPAIGNARLASVDAVTVRPSGAIVVTGTASVGNEFRIFSAVIPAEASFDGLGHLTGGTNSGATGISADGETVVGFADYSPSVGANTYTYATRWTATRGLVDLGAGAFRANGVSGDGEVVAGMGRSGDGFRWREDGNGRWLGYSTNAAAISVDGRVTAGWSSGPDGVNHAFRWNGTSTEMYKTYVGTQLVPSYARALSADGSVFVGTTGPTTVGDVTLKSHAFRWDDQGHQLDLGDLPGGEVEASANGISGDGVRIVGSSSSAAGTEAFLWTEADGMRGLGTVPGATGAFYSNAAAISPDGTVIVGSYRRGGSRRAFVWDAVHGMRDLRDLIVDGGGTAAAGWVLTDATGVTTDANGRVYIVGSGANSNGNEAFRATLPAPKFDPRP